MLPRSSGASCPCVKCSKLGNCHVSGFVQVNRRQAQAEAVAAEYAALQQEHVNLENELLESKSQVQLLQAEVRQANMVCICTLIL